MHQPLTRLKKYTRVAESLLINGNEIVEGTFRSNLKQFEILELYNANDDAYRPVRDTSAHIVQMLKDGYQLQVERKESIYTYIEKGNRLNEQSSAAQRKSYDHTNVAQGVFSQVDKGSPPKRNSYDDAGVNKLGLKSPPKLTSFDFGTKIEKNESMTESLGTTPVSLKIKKADASLTAHSQSTHIKTEGEISEQKTTDIPANALKFSNHPNNSSPEARDGLQPKSKDLPTTEDDDEFGDFQESDASPEQDT